MFYTYSSSLYKKKTQPISIIQIPIIQEKERKPIIKYMDMLNQIQNIKTTRCLSCN